MARSIPLKPSLESAVEQMKKESDYFDDFKRGAKRVLWRTITLQLVSSQHCLRLLEAAQSSLDFTQAVYRHAAQTVTMRQ